MTVQLITLFLLFISSGFYLISHIYENYERNITINYLFSHIMIDIVAVVFTYIVLKLFIKWGKEKFNKKLYIISLIQLSIYFMLIVLNGFLDIGVKGNIYLKPIFIGIEFIVYLIYLYKVVKNILTKK